ncbi:LamG domain-containing protein [Rhodopirellula halodulae]|uniref:LamG domain-containing protein n=1 Tax=Rhodopirellula halodulae TaxID=2894198 RepID=UPI001E341C72|nr:LamG domain-containing protein [Rhodopirellula sp. JC737]MCC9658832.1 LamG domain-containing protein [Rhodopirellula sp. JC737]
MNDPNAEFIELRSLILKSQSEELSEAEAMELNRLINLPGGAEEAAKLVDQLCALSDATIGNSLSMHDECSMPLTNVPAKAARPERNYSTFPETRNERSHSGYNRRNDENTQSKNWTRAYWLVGLAASHLVIGSFAWSLAKPDRNQPAIAAVTLESKPPQIVSMTACVWGQGSIATPTLGQSINQGEILNLVEGVAELKVGDGTSHEALVRIEGPASIFIREDGQLGLASGTLTAKSLGFGSEQVSVITPIGLVLVDGQSSIGLVSQNDVHEVHLFSGRCLVLPSQAFGTSDIRLEEGDAVRLSTAKGIDSGVVLFEASMASFASARSNAFDPLHLDDRYVDAILDSEPDIYWRFEGLEGDFPQQVKNQGRLPGHNASVVGNPGWRQYQGNRVAELGLTDSASAFTSDALWPPEPLDDYTIEAWVKPQLYHHGEMICLVDPIERREGRHDQALLLEAFAREWFYALKVLGPNRMRFSHRSPPSGLVLDGENLVSEEQYQVRVWQHVIAQKSAKELSLWIDGNLAAQQEADEPLPANMQILIGQLYPTKNYRPYVGQIDEIAFYSRALPKQEIRKHIRASGRALDFE